MSNSNPPNSTPDAPSDAPPTSSNPLTLLSTLEPSKKYTLVFLVSVGATLLVTGASGGRLLKRAKKMSAEPVVTPISPSVATPVLPKIQLATARHHPSAKASSSLLSSSSATTATSRQSLIDLATSFPPIQPPTRSLLRQWSKDKGSDLSFWLPNSSLTASSEAAAAKADAYDKAQEGDDVEREYVDDGFNPAIYAAKAFGIASLITVGTFAAGIFGVMKYFGVSDLESLSLALSHRLPPVLDSHRPAIPAWALPTAKLVETPGEEEENDEHKEGVAYWVEVKEILDREAEERVVLRRKQWEKISNVTSK